MTGIQLPPIPQYHQQPRPKSPFGLSTRAQIIAASCACAAGSLFLFTFNPTQHAFYPQCFLYKTTGLYCAGCGGTRAVYALLHGRVLEAMHDNVIFVCALPLIAWAMAKLLIPAWKNNRWPDPVAPRSKGLGAILIFAIVILFSLVRNIPLDALDVIRPECQQVHLTFLGNHIASLGLY